jgi:hypothetical protein
VANLLQQFPKEHCFLEGSQAAPVCRCRWVRNIGGMVLTGETEVLGENYSNFSSVDHFFLIILLYSYMFRPMSGHHQAYKTKSKERCQGWAPLPFYIKANSYRVFASVCKVYNKSCTVSVGPCVGIIQCTARCCLYLYFLQPNYCAWRPFSSTQKLISPVKICIKILPNHLKIPLKWSSATLSFVQHVCSGCSVEGCS